MTITYYENPEDLPKEIEERLTFDSSRCELGVLCGARRAPIGIYLSMDPETSADVPAFETVAVLTSSCPEEEPVLACEDCATWVEDVAGPKVFVAEVKAEPEGGPTNDRHNNS